VCTLTSAIVWLKCTLHCESYTYLAEKKAGSIIGTLTLVKWLPPRNPAKPRSNSPYSKPPEAFRGCCGSNFPVLDSPPFSLEFFSTIVENLWNLK